MWRATTRHFNISKLISIRQGSFIPPLRDSGIEGLNFLKVTKTASQIFYIEPTNPPVNALRSEMLEDFEKVAEIFKSNPPRCIVMKCDVAGANIKEMQSQSPEQSEAYANRAKAAFKGLRSTGAPIIGFTTKYAIGGGLELLMHADIRYAGPKAFLQAPEVELDTYQSFGGTYLLPRYLGSGLALRSQLRSDAIKLKDALQHGLITEVIEDVDPNATLAKAFDDALVIARKKPSVVRKNVNMVRFSEYGDIDEVCKEESKGFGETFEGGALGMRRFLEKYRVEEWGPEDSTVIHSEFKALGIDTTQISSLHEIMISAEQNPNVKAIFLCGDVSGGDIKKLYATLTTTPGQFSEFLEREYIWHEDMRVEMKTPIFYFGGKLLGGGGLGVFNSTTHKICNPDTVFTMPEIELGACPDVAATYDLSRLGSVGRAMATAAIDLNGNEAKLFGLSQYLVPKDKMEQLKECLLDSIVSNGYNAQSIDEVINQHSIEPEAPRHSQEEFDSLFSRSFSLEQVVQKVRDGKDVEGSLAQRAYNKMQAASSYGIVLADIMNSIGIDLELRRTRALEYEVWNNMEKADFMESIYSRFILPRKERRAPSFFAPAIFDMPTAEITSMRSDLEDFISSLLKKSKGTEELMFSDITVREPDFSPPQPKVSQKQQEEAPAESVESENNTTETQKKE